MASLHTVFLVGYMGSGKSTLGKRLARHLGWTFLDLDEHIVARIGLSIPAFFEKYDEAAFRAIERDALRNLQLHGPSIIATGGGTPCFHENMTWMNEHGATIYLKLSSKTLWQRLEASDLKRRPVLQGLKGLALLRFIDEKLQARSPYYEQAQFVIHPLHDKIPDIVQKCRLQPR